jgi:hypothetical protein
MRKLAEATGKNIVLEPSATGDLSAYFKDMDLRKGLALLAETNGLAMREKDGIYSFYRESWGSAAKDATGAASPGRLRVQVKDKLVTLEVVGAPIAEIIASISAQSGISTVVYGELKGTVTMRIADIPIEQALQILFRGTDFTFWMHNNIYFIGPQTMQVLNNSKLIVLKHLKVDDVMEMLPASLTKDAQLKVVKSQNAIMVMGTYEIIDGLTQYIGAANPHRGACGGCRHGSHSAIRSGSFHWRLQAGAQHRAYLPECRSSAEQAAQPGHRGSHSRRAGHRVPAQEFRRQGAGSGAGKGPQDPLASANRHLERFGSHHHGGSNPILPSQE